MDSCVLVSHVGFFLYQAFQYSAALQFKSSRENLNAKMPCFLNLNLLLYVFKITFLFLCFYVDFSSTCFLNYFQYLVFNFQILFVFCLLFLLG